MLRSELNSSTNKDGGYQSYTGQSPQHRCDECGKVFTAKGNLKLHQNTIHSATRFQCQYCQKSFKRKHHLQSHIITHVQF
ncbi:hypothetical protein ACF0H5_019317 [Mactra antiquata]